MQRWVLFDYISSLSKKKADPIARLIKKPSQTT